MKDLIEKIEREKWQESPNAYCRGWNSAIDRVVDILAHQKEMLDKRGDIGYDYRKAILAQLASIGAGVLADVKPPELCRHPAQFTMLGGGCCGLPKGHEGKHRIYYGKQRSIEWD